MAFELRFMILSTGKSKIETQIWRHQCNIKKVNVIYQIINLAWFDLFSFLGPIGTQINQTSFDFVTLSLSSYELKHIHFHWHEQYSYYVHKYFLICIHLPRNWCFIKWLTSRPIPSMDSPNVPLYQTLFANSLC